MIYRCYRNGRLVATTERADTTEELEHQKLGIKTQPIKTTMGLLNFIKAGHMKEMQRNSMFGVDKSDLERLQEQFPIVPLSPEKDTNPYGYTQIMKLPELDDFDK
jgi:hypothetical protein